MFLSKLILNSRDPQVRRDLSRPYEMHRTLWSAFPEGDPGRVLFRVDTDRSGAPPFVLVQSDFRPEWKRLAERSPDYLLAPPDLKELHPAFFPSQRLRFRLRANPTKRVAAKNERLGGVMAGKRVALVHENDQITWLLRKGEAGGFRIPGQWITADNIDPMPNFRVDVIPEGWVHCDKKGHSDGRFYAVRFDGLLEVTDPDLFLQTITDGVGAAKGFGFGLLSVAPWRD
jgi:CRISPR system Cascade subunit CasE